MPSDSPAKPAESEQELDRISSDLKDQVRRAKDRISDRYAKLIEERSFDREDKRKA